MVMLEPIPNSLSPQQMNAVFSALADPTRRALLSRLAQGDATVSDLADPFPISQPAISKHLKVLEEAGLIERHRRGQQRPARLRPETLTAATEWMARFKAQWETRLDQMDELLGRQPDLPADPPHPTDTHKED